MAAVMESLSFKTFDISLACGLFAVLVLFFSQVRVSSVLTKYPLLRAELGSYQKREQEYIVRAKELYREGYQKVRLLI